MTREKGGALGEGRGRAGNKRTKSGRNSFILSRSQSDAVDAFSGHAN